MKKVNYFAIIAAAVAAVSVFLPWVQASSSASFGDYHSSYTTGGISGISTGAGIVGLLVAIVGVYMTYKQLKWAYICGVINFLDGLSCMLGWFGLSARGTFSSSLGGGSSSASIDPQYGLFIFIISSAVFVIATFLKRNQILTDINFNNIDKLIYDTIQGLLMSALAFCFIYACFCNLTSCDSKSKSNSSSSQTFKHFCGHCSKGFNGGGYLKDSGGDVMSVPSSDIESYPLHYCTKSCALLD
jgi:hypothetical protein